jgi:hypothetical protein
MAIILIKEVIDNYGLSKKKKKIMAYQEILLRL